MNEEEKVNNFNETANQAKDELKEGAREVSDTIKNVNFKEDTVATGHFVKDMLFYPIEKVKEVANAQDGSYLKYAIIIIALYCIGGFAGSLDTLFASYSFGRKIINILESTITPLLYVLIPTLVMLFIPTTEKKSLTKVLIPLMAICFVPTVMAKYIEIVPFINDIKLFSIPLDAICGVLRDFTVILEFVAIKELYTTNEGNKAFIKYGLVFGIASILQTVIKLFI